MMQTASAIAAAIGAKLEGDGSIELRGVAAPERAGPHDLIYVEKAKHADRAVASASLCVIAAENIALTGKTVLRSSYPKVAFAKAASLVLEKTPIAIGIHPTAIIAPLAGSRGDSARHNVGESDQCRRPAIGIFHSHHHSPRHQQQILRH